MAKAQAEGCPCGGPLHRADFPRSPCRLPSEMLTDGKVKRFSLCCSRDNCRHRVTPPSVRFLGRRVYCAAVVVLVTAMQHGLTPARVSDLREEFGVSWATVARWRQWWLKLFTVSPVWKELRGRLLPPVDESRLPASWMERYVGLAEEAQVRRVLGELLPLTTGSTRWKAGFSVVV